MRVLLVTDWNSNTGGAESYIMTLRDSLRAAGDEVRLLACGAELDDELRPHEIIRGTDRASAQAFLQLVNPFAVTRVRAAAREFRPDVAFVSHFAYHLSPAALAGLRKVPTVVSVTDYKCICPLGTKLLPDNALCAVRAGVVCQRNGCVSTPHWLRDRPRYAMIRSALSRVDRVVSPSRWIQKELETAGVRAEHVPLGVRPAGSRFRRAPAATPLFVYCGRLAREKGVPLLIRAFARSLYAVPDAQLRIVGDGPERPALEDLVEALDIGDSVDFAGKVARDRVEAELANAWAVVAPSLWAEPFGLIALEAAVRGVPVIASATGGFAELVEDNVSGLLFPNGNERALTECIRAVGARKTFPTQRLPADVVERAAEAGSQARHAGRIRSIFSELITAKRVELGAS
ncbi:MAG TPA: glycosyltransferase family 4 protein [Gemmatimonadaceae bacterium]|nr:glycosyltransferase family 4 protein [Gemmatimonadaceae bacterium]